MTRSSDMLETAALCDEVFLMKKKILIVKEETMFYREKLHDLQDIAESHKIKPIPLDITGRPVFPIALGGLTVHSLGEVRTRFYFESSYNKHTA
ncbi:transforming growth factor beta regulator 1-like isoform X2 [Zootermopsis nevadensis]|uniref:transforming growth factor beta regulator 1-like isoform X2 n=1 Tax=Zootermopsis nevadensis TaxID=136037 RepID=UPI000B8EC48F|nr:transforming growth factor beta regulator 1-like isoform X2 [Zootermopsis nevadensis]